MQNIKNLIIEYFETPDCYVKKFWYDIKNLRKNGRII